eukprot:TRINITY_DN13519_c0_g3_i1.p1 TRINITY_DN13519_c0_g3~~TRINITY_DN13519_c0_g3_i1.p1  ORF type:complete len:335 (+),score=178.07 TRINITY_DN13519_c0_g3_i1:67-1071(+)
MAMMVEFAMDPALEKELNEKKGDKETRWIKVVIKDEKLIHDGSGKATDSGDADVKALRESASADEPFYGLINATSDNEWIVLAFIPDTAKVKSRMQYSSSLPSMKKRLGTTCIGDARITEKDEISWATVEETVSKKKGRVDNSDVMSHREKAMQEVHSAEEKESKDRAVAAARSSTHTLQFPIADDAKEALEKASKGDLRCVILKNENEKFALETTFADASVTIEEVAKKLEKESRFIVFIHKHDDADKTLFIYYASDQCPVKKRMQYASSKAACVEKASEAGNEIVKRLEFTEQSDFTTQALNEALAPAEEEPEEEQKPKPKVPANRGPRMLI